MQLSWLETPSHKLPHAHWQVHDGCCVPCSRSSPTTTVLNPPPFLLCTLLLLSFIYPTDRTPVDMKHFPRWSLVRTVLTTAHAEINSDSNIGHDRLLKLDGGEKLCVEGSG
ncbi:hypothetical protein GGX14DRAFT_562517 [Mycena pura]|uniref:Uncharacterized protein n=1 Tax=Mycena pura TaxID=153505 RepID=A0AAD6VU97_9AGAR|nr:hypothetical protein GGX14DRAFT_562517 [Mycena pura]